MATFDTPKICEIGSVLYEIPTDEKPFPGTSSHLIRFKTTTEEPALILTMAPILSKISNRHAKKALAEDPKGAYVTGVELAGDLAVVLITRPSLGLQGKRWRI